MTVQCCVCRRVKDEGRWSRRDTGRNEEVSHTYCPACLHESIRQMEAEGVKVNTPAAARA